MTARRVCLDARLVSGVLGGVEQGIIGLAHGFSQLADGDEEYVFLTYTDSREWLRPYVQGRCRLEGDLDTPRSLLGTVRLGPVTPVLRSAWHRLSPLLGRRGVPIPRSDGSLEGVGASLVHFTVPVACLTHLPSIYQFYDLQHRHLPGLFTPRERVARDYQYHAFCDQASLVSTLTEWGKQDLVQQLGLPPNKVVVVPWAPALSAYPAPTEMNLLEVQRRFGLPDRFLFYPAQSWPHKNHLGLLDALAQLRDQQSLRIPLVCSGARNRFFPQIERRVHDLGLADQVTFLGFVNELDLHCLYRLCRALVFPSRFEGFGMPLLEAFLTGVPVACSNAACLPELAADAAVLFDPESPREMAQAIQRVWTDEALRHDLVARGRRQVAHYSWERTARMLRAHYRRLAGWPLTDEDHALLLASGAPPAKQMGVTE